MVCRELQTNAWTLDGLFSVVWMEYLLLDDVSYTAAPNVQVCELQYDSLAEQAPRHLHLGHASFQIILTC